MKIRIVNKDRHFDELKAPWNEIVSRANLHIFQTFEWNRAWWKYFGSGKNLHLILFYDDGQLIGIVPLFWDTVHFLGKDMYTCLRFIGSNVSQPNGESLIGSLAYTDYLDVIVDPDFEDKVATKLTAYFKNGNLGFDEILFEEVPEKSMICTHLVPAMKDNGLSALVYDDSNSVNIVLNNSWNEYLKSVGKNRRKKIQRYLRAIHDENNKVFELHEVQDQNELHDVFETLVQVHQQQWNNQGFPGMFYEKRMYDFTKETCRQFFNNGWLQIKKLTPKQENENSCVAIDLFYIFNRRVYSIIGGLNYNSPLSSNSPGNVIFADTLKNAIEKKFEVFDYLRGLQNYKQRKGDRVNTNKRIEIHSPSRKDSRKVATVKKIIRIKRRLSVEAIHLKVSFSEKNITQGVRNYLSFLSQRVEKKWENNNLFNSSK